MIVSVMVCTCKIISHLFAPKDLQTTYVFRREIHRVINFAHVVRLPTFKGTLQKAISATSECVAQKYNLGRS